MRRTIAGLALILASGGPYPLADDKPTAPAPLEAFLIAGTKVKAADSDAPMAEGWPRETPPGRIEVKDYPGYRSAVARGKGASLGADNVLFFPLFRHITSSEIAMTTPVVSTYSDGLVKDAKSTGEMSMEFVYRSPSMGQPGQGVGAVIIEDHPAASFACLGVQGDLDPDRMIRGVAVLRAWLGDRKGEWVEDGPPRRLGYHGPMTRKDERLWEVQIPIKPAPKPAPGAKP